MRANKVNIKHMFWGFKMGVITGRKLKQLASEKQKVTKTQTATAAIKSIIAKFGVIQDSAHYYHRGNGVWSRYDIKSDKKKTGKLAKSKKQWKSAPWRYDIHGVDTVERKVRVAKAPVAPKPKKIVGFARKPTVNSASITYSFDYNNKPWIAQITGIDAGGNLQRGFLNGDYDYSHLNPNNKNKGKRITFTLSRGSVYEVKTPESGRFFCAVSPSGKIYKINKTKIMKIVNKDKGTVEDKKYITWLNGKLKMLTDNGISYKVTKDGYATLNKGRAGLITFAAARKEYENEKKRVGN